MKIVRTEQLNKWYGEGETLVKAVDNVNLSIEKGEFVSLVGHSGSGKSTLLHLLGAVDRPTGGRIFIDNDDISTLPEKRLAVLRRRKIGFIFQFFNLLPVLTVEENIVMPLLMDRQKIDSGYLEKMLDILGLKDRRDHLPSELSGGQQQRVSIGRALISNPAIVLADEPTGNLDSKNGRDILDLLKLTMKEFGQTLLLVTHDRELACEADRILQMSDGCLINDGRGGNDS